jgi:hypothetical protein
MIEPDNCLTKARRGARRIVIRASLSDEDIDRMIKQAQKKQGGSRRQPILLASPAKAGVHLSAAQAADAWVPAYPTDQVRGLKAHGTAGCSRFHILRVGKAGGGLKTKSSRCLDEDVLEQQRPCKRRPQA